MNRSPGPLLSRLGPWVWILAMAPLLPVVGLGFLGDDLAARAVLGPEHWPFVWECFVPHGGEFYRPLGFLWLQLEMVLTMETAWLIHGVHLALFVVAGWQTGRLAERLTGMQIGAWVAALALVYPGRLESSTWIIAIFDLTALLAVQLGLLMYLEEDERPRWWLMAAIGFLAPAFKEVGYAFAPVLTAWWFLGIGRSSARGRRVFAAWTGAAFSMVVRFVAFGGIGGYEGTSLAGALQRVKVLPEVLVKALLCPVNPSMGRWSLIICWTCVLVGLVAVIVVLRHWRAGGSATRLVVAGLSLTLGALLPAFPYLRADVLWSHSRFMTLPAVGIVLLVSAGLLGERRSHLALFSALVLCWSVATTLNVWPWLQAAQARDVILEGVGVVSESPGPHTIWVDGPIGHLDGAHLIGGFLPFALEVEFPGREIDTDSRFLQRLQGRDQKPPDDWRGTLHLMEFSRQPLKMLEIKTKPESRTHTPGSQEGH